MARLGIWFIGARGSVATTATLGARGLAAGLVPPVGCVSEHPEIDGHGLAGWDDVVIGGHDVVDTPLHKRAESLVAGGVVPGALLEALRDELAATEARLRTGLVGRTDRQRADVARLAQDIREFGADVDRVVVVDVASTEPPHDPGLDVADIASLEAAWDAGRAPLAPSSVYAAAAIEASAAYVGFTPSPGVEVPALRELAERRGVPFAGRDGKTGETLVKSALAPMFATRALPVRSWTSVNLLGGGDGATLADPAAAESKTTSKRDSLDAILGQPVDGPMHIDYVPDLGDWKTAWDHVRFEGFLGAQMTLQFTWQGCDSTLAAPLVLDLARLAGRAHEAGIAGPVPELGFFFKAPLGAPDADVEHRLAEQWHTLTAWSRRCADLLR